MKGAIRPGKLVKDDKGVNTGENLFNAEIVRDDGSTVGKRNFDTFAEAAAWLSANAE